MGAAGFLAGGRFRRVIAWRFSGESSRRRSEGSGLAERSAQVLLRVGSRRPPESARLIS